MTARVEAVVGVSETLAAFLAGEDFAVPAGSAFFLTVFPDLLGDAALVGGFFSFDFDIMEDARREPGGIRGGRFSPTCLPSQD